MTSKLKFHRRSDILVRSGIRFRDQLKLLAKPEVGFIKSIIIITLTISFLNLGVPLAIQTIVNNIVVRTIIQPLIVMSCLLFFILSCCGLLQAIQTYTVEILQRRLFIRYGLVIGERLTAYQDQKFKKANSPDLINRYFDVMTMQSNMVIFFVNGFGFIIQFLIGFSLLIFYHPYFLGLAAFMALFLIFTWYFFGPDGVKAGSPEADGKYNVVSWIEELSRVRNIFTSDNGKSFSNNKINTLFNRWLVVRNRLFKFQFRQHIALQVFSVVMNILLLLLGGFLVLKQQLSTGQLVAAALVVNSIVSNIPNLQSFFFSVYNYSTSLDMIARFYDFPLEQEKGELLAPKSYDFKFDNLRFEPNYLFNFEYKERSKNLIFVKSFSSLEHFYDGVMGFTDQVSGNVMFDGKLIQDLDIGEIRNHIQLIAYDQFFSGTVLENLTGLGSKKLFTQTELQDVLMRVGLFENIDKLPQKLETQIRPNGFPFTKSQLLAIQVAKAILLQPKILMVTPDYEQISTYKRKLIYREILNRQNDWTLLFFTQRFHKGSFDRYSVLERNKMKELTGEADLLKEIENYV